MRILLTGVTGQFGHHLKPRSQARDCVALATYIQIAIIEHETRPISR